jgi:TM2 domain-containing membrane protein YozV
MEEDINKGAGATQAEFKESWNQAVNNQDNKKLLVGILAIVLGWVGVHKFLLGYNKEGIILLVLGVLGFVTCGITSMISGVIGLIEGIIYLTKTDEEFYTTYQLGRKPWF